MPSSLFIKIDENTFSWSHRKGHINFGWIKNVFTFGNQNYTRHIGYLSCEWHDKGFFLLLYLFLLILFLLLFSFRLLNRSTCWIISAIERICNATGGLWSQLSLLSRIHFRKSFIFLWLFCSFNQNWIVQWFRFESNDACFDLTDSKKVQKVESAGENKESNVKELHGSEHVRSVNQEIHLWQNLNVRLTALIFERLVAML